MKTYGNARVRNNWVVISSFIIYNLKFSINRDTNRNRCKDVYSLDEILGGLTETTSGHMCSAKQLVELLGQKRFKRLIECCWNKNITNHEIKSFTSISPRHLVSTFCWVKTPEGYKYWADVRNLLIKFEEQK